MVELTKKADYALRLMVDVAANPSGPQRTSDVATRENIPYQFLRKVVQELVAAGLLTSSRGVRGGLVLGQPADTISLLEIVRAVDEPAVSRCVVDPAVCTRRSRCVIYPVWRRIQRDMERAMEEVLLSDLVDRHRLVSTANGNQSPAPEQAEWPQKETPIVSSIRNRKTSKVEVTPERRPQ